VGIALLLGTFGVLNITDLHNAMSGHMSNPIVLTAIGLILLGWLFESGLFPFHTIKSNLYSSAKPDVGALLQTETKIVLIAIAVVMIRLFGGFSNMSALMLGLSAVTLVFGAIMALVQNDFRRLVAFSAVSQAGLVGLSMGLGTEQGVSAGIFHAVNDALAMSLIFITLYLIYERANTTEFSKLGGLLTKAPKLALIQMVGILAVSGIPPFNAYQSEYRIIEATFGSGYPELGVIVILGTILTFVALMKGFYLTFLKENIAIAAKDRIFISNKIPPATLLALLVLVIVCIGIGVYPDPFYERIMDATIMIVGGW
jgi:energy-converting hydrogenase B subunit F